MQTSAEHIAQQIRSCLPPEKKEASWGYLASEFPWFNIIHWLRANDHPEDEALLQKAALYAPQIIRLHGWLHTNNQPFTPAIIENHEAFSTKEVSDIEEPIEIISSDAPETANEIPADDISIDDPVSVPENHDAAIKQEGEESGNEEQALATPDLNLPGLATLQLPAQEAMADIPLEPYHAIDYFASQGIKVEKTLPGKEETQLDKQVKSFTDWLKTMKKLKYQPATQYVDPLVETQAKKSLDKKEIVTEAMAEVWAKQGKFEEASQVYARLMLLHPEKTPYFAARLQELNTKQ